MELVTYLTDAAETLPGEHPPRVGDRVELRCRPGGAAIEAWSVAGRRLGRVPPAECAELTEWLSPGANRLPARIAALVPRRGGGAGRIHIRVSA